LEETIGWSVFTELLRYNIIVCAFCWTNL